MELAVVIIIAVVGICGLIGVYTVRENKKKIDQGIMINRRGTA